MSKEIGRLYKFSRFELDPAQRLLLREGRIVQLTPKAIDLLLVLVESHGRVISKEDLLQRVWPDSFVEEANLSHNIYKLREALGGDSEGVQCIETLPRRGYRFVAQVEEIHPDTGELIVEEHSRTQIVVEEESADVAAPGGHSIELRVPGPALGTRQHRLATKALVFRAMVMVMAAGSAFGLYMMLRGHTEAATPFSSMSITKLTDSGNVYNAAISPDGKYIVHVIRDNENQSLWLRHIPTGSNTQVIPPINETYIGLTFSRDGNYFYFVRSDKNHPGEYYLFRAPVLGGNPHLVTADVDTPISFSPDGSAMVFLRNNPQARQVNLMIANADGTGERVLAARNAPDDFGGPPDWAPDGKWVAVHSFTANGMGALQTIDVASGRTIEVAGAERSSSSRIEVLPVRWMPDGKGLVTAYHSQTKGVLHLQIGYVAYPSGKRSRITNDLNDYSRWALSVTSDGKSLVTVQSERTFGLWIMPAEANGTGKAQQIGRDKDEGLAIAWTGDGHILTNRDKSDFVFRNADGSNKATIYSARAPAYGATVCGNYLVMAGGEEGKGRNILRADLTRGVMKQLTFGEWNSSPACSPDGQWIVYASSDTARQGIFKVSIDGGAAQKITGLEGYAPAFSPDGKLVAFAYYEGTGSENWRWKIVVISADGGDPLQVFEASRGGARRFLFEEPFGRIQFTADGTGLIYPIYDGEVDNLWIQPLSGRPYKLTFFKSGLIEDYAVSPDGKSIALLRGQLDRDAVQIKDANR